MDKKYAIVTGVASGIGQCVANNISKKGIHVFGLDINKIQNDEIDYIECDIKEEGDVVTSINKIKEKTSCIDYLINCAGIFCFEKRNRIEDLPLMEWKNVLDVNLTGTFLMTKYAIPLLKNSSSGVIINLSSEQVAMPQEKGAPYAISKAGIEMFSKILAMELMDNKIRVNTIALASVRTNFIKKYKNDEEIFNKMMEETNKNMPFGIIEPKDVYDAIEFLIEKNNKITGQTILIDSGVILNKNRKK